MPWVFVSNGTRISALDVAAPAQRWPLGSMTVADESRELRASLNSSAASPGAVPSASLDPGDEDTRSACADTVRGVAKTTPEAISATTKRTSQRWVGAELREPTLPPSGVIFSGIGTIQ